MNVRVIIDPTADEPFIEIHTASITPELTDIINELSASSTKQMYGFKGDEIFPIRPEQIICARADGGSVYAETDMGTMLLRYKMYELDTFLREPTFLKISKSEIINFKKVKSMDMSISGTITVTLSNGTKTFVSRRYVTKIKDFLGF